jgi:hypothetical protein
MKEMTAAAIMPPLAKGQIGFRPGNCFASFDFVSRLPRVSVESDASSQSFILIHTSVAGKVGSYRRQEKPFLFHSGAPRLEYWSLENHPISWLIDREAKL